MKIRSLLVLCLLFVFPGTASAISVVCKNCSTSLVQAIQQSISQSQLARLIAQYKEAVKQTALELRMVQQNIEQYANMVKNTMELPMELVGEVSSTFMELAALTGQLQTLRGDITSLGEMYTQLYPGQATFKGFAGSSGTDVIGQYQNHWDTWSENVDRASRATFQLSGKQLQDMQKNSPRLQQYINKLLSTPDGQQKALMAGNQLSALQIEETRQLRELIATNIQSDLADLAKKEKASQMQEELWRELKKTDNLENLSSKPDPF